MANGFTSKVIFVIGVSGSGKTTVGRLLANEMGVAFIDADDHHPQENIAKMSSGIPLTDGDRAPWLHRLNLCAKDHLSTGCVIACSALKKAYRDRLSNSIEKEVRWVYLKGSYEDIIERMQLRQDHFMKPGMLRSQFESLEEPEESIEVNIGDSPEEIVTGIKRKLGI